MTDTWERRPVPCTEGYNYCGNSPLFTVTYDALLDRLIMQSSLPLFAALDEVIGAGESPDGTPGWNFVLPNGSFSIQSPTEAWLDGAWAFLVFAPPGQTNDIQQLDFYNAGAVLIGTWTGSVLVTEPVPLIDVTAADVLGDDFVLTGTGLDTALLRWRIFDDFAFDVTYYDSAGPNAGLNPVGSIVTVTANTVTINDPNFIPAGIGPTDVQTRNSLNVVVDELFLASYPHLYRICSPAADTIRFEGERFLTATAGAVGYVIPRGTAPILGGPAAIYELADGSPDANGWSLVTHTDTVIEISNPVLVATDVIQGVAFHEPLAITMYYYEPWGLAFSQLVDGLGGCSNYGAFLGPFLDAATAPNNDEIILTGGNLTTGYSSPADLVRLITAANFSTWVDFYLTGFNGVNPGGTVISALTDGGVTIAYPGLSAATVYAVVAASEDNTASNQITLDSPVVIP